MEQEAALYRRKKLPSRRRSETFEFDVKSQFGRETMHYITTVGFYPSGKVAEVFIRAGKPGSSLNIAMLELSTVVSIALQWSVPLEALRSALPRNSETPEGALGALLDLITDTGIKDAIRELLE